MDKLPDKKTNRSGKVFLSILGVAIIIAAGVAFDITYNHAFIKSLRQYRRIFESISLLGLGWTQVLLIVAMFFYSRKANLVVEAREALRGASIAGAAAYVSSGVLSQIIKHLVGRPRPYMNDPWGFIGPTLSNRYHSFPSGHTTTSFALAYVLASFFPRWKWVFYGLAVLVGISRVALDEHYPLDMAGGAVLGLLCGWFVVQWFRSRQKSE